MQIIAEVPLNFYRTPSKTVRATTQKKFFLKIYTYFYAVQIGEHVFVEVAGPVIIFSNTRGVWR